MLTPPWLIGGQHVKVTTKAAGKRPARGRSSRVSRSEEAPKVTSTEPRRKRGKGYQDPPPAPGHRINVNGCWYTLTVSVDRVLPRRFHELNRLRGVREMRGLRTER